MKYITLLVLVILALLVPVSGCIPKYPVNGFPTSTPAIEAPGTILDPKAQETQQPTQTTPPLLSAEGPFLLLQTGFSDYQILDLKNKNFYPFLTPGEGQFHNLAANLSPNRQKIIFHIDDETIKVMDLVTGMVTTTYDLSADLSKFQSDQAANEALQFLADELFSTDRLIASIEQSLLASLHLLRWHQSDQYRLSVQVSSPSRTNLFLDDDQTGIRQKLEDLPGLVSNFWVSPDQTQILLKKAFVFDPRTWQDDRYYLVDIQHKTAKPLNLPQDIDNPSLFWLMPQAIGVIHQTKLVGGLHFSIINTETLHFSQIIDGDFTAIRMFRNSLLIQQQDSEKKQTKFKLLTLSGKIIKAQIINNQCSIHSIVGGHSLLNCETESMLMDDTLALKPFGLPISILSTSPNQANTVLVDREENSFLLDEEFNNHQLLLLEGVPFEIRWLLDSSGFLYRTSGELYHFSLESQESHHLLTTDIFTDYANLNAVWVNLNPDN